MIKHLATLIVLLLITGCSVLETKGPLIGEYKSTASSATLRFDNGRISGSDGCNRYGSTYTASGDSLIISDKMMSTEMACEEERMKTADQFRQSLMRIKRYRSEGKTLTLMSESGEVLGEFIRIEKQQK